MRITHITPFFDPATQYGGPVTQLREVCKRLANRGHTVHVVTTNAGIDSDLPLDQWIAKDGYRVWYAKAGRLGRIAPHYAPGMRQPIQQIAGDTDVFHTTLSFTHANIMARDVAIQHRVPYIYTPRSCLDPVRLAQRRFSKKLFMSMFERKIIRDAALIHALTDAEKKQIIAQGVPEAKIRIISNGCDLADRDSWPEPGLFRRHFHISNETKLVLFLGRLHRVKGLDILVNGFAEALPRIGDATLVFAGREEGGTRIIRRHASRHGIQDRIRLVGHLSDELKIAAYRDSDVFALTSYSEGLPNSVLEALACGCPVAITPACHVPEIGRENAGCIVEDRDELKQALTRLLGEPNPLVDMGNNAIRLVRKDFTFRTVINKLVLMYESIR